MYIWILLATIMVAFSFLNISPRRDKENVFIEARAIADASRFRAEHLAFYRLIECELINNAYPYNASNTVYDSEASGNRAKLQNNLPIGYELNAGTTVYHRVYCIKDNKKLGDSGAEFTDCNGSSSRYAVSFWKIPDRWISKEMQTITDTANNTFEVAMPLPEFNNVMSRETTMIRNTGWTVCNNNLCQLMGRTATRMSYDKHAGDADKVKLEKFWFPEGIFNDTDFTNACTSATPCLFAYDRLKTTDNSGRCMSGS